MMNACSYMGSLLQNIRSLSLSMTTHHRVISVRTATISGTPSIVAWIVEWPVLVHGPPAIRLWWHPLAVPRLLERTRTRRVPVLVEKTSYRAGIVLRCRPHSSRALRERHSAPPDDRRGSMDDDTLRRSNKTRRISCCCLS